MKSFDNMDEVYLYFCKKIKNAPVVAPRGLKVSELLGESFELTNPRNRIIYNNERNISLSFSIGEFLWYLRGSDSLEIMKYYSKMYPKFSDDGEGLYGAYGKRIFQSEAETLTSWDKVIKLLRIDQDSRQAVIPIYNTKDLGANSKDIPCTCLIQFFIRFGKLNSVVYMRSNDLYLGMPYDVFSFTMLQELMANELGVELGTYMHIVGSLHVYESHFNKIDSISNSPMPKVHSMPKMSFLDHKQKKRLLEEEERIRVNKEYFIEDIDDYWKSLLYVLAKKANIVKNDFSNVCNAFKLTLR